MPQETTPLLPPPSPNRGRAKLSTKPRAKQALCYALLLLLGLGIGSGATLAWQRRPKSDDKGPMVPPIYKLPPVSVE